MTISKEVLDELLGGVERAEDFFGDKGLMKELKVRMMERMLGAELTEHLGYEPGAQPASQQSNRRNGSTRKALKGNDGAVPIDIPCHLIRTDSPTGPTVPPCSGTGNQKGRGNGRAGWVKYAGKSSLWDATPRRALRPTPTQFGSINDCSFEKGQTDGGLVKHCCLIETLQALPLFF